MYKKIILTIIIFIIISSNTTLIFGQPDILCEAVILIDADSGKVLYEKNSDKQMYPASLTKVLTAIIALETGNLEDIITVDDKTPYEIDGSHIALEPGEKLSLKDLLYGLLIPSANDAASVIAKHYSGSIENFSKIMNEKAKEIGAINTNFTNPHGLHDSEHYTTAEDLAKIAAYAIKNDTFKEIVSTTQYEINPTNKKSERRIFNTTNKLLYGQGYGQQIKIDGKWIDVKYEGAQGLKTGYTPEAGSCLISYAERNDMRLITVVLRGNVWDVYTDTHNLLNYGFNNYEPLQLINKNEFIKNIEVENGTSKYISVITNDDLKVVVNKNITGKLKENIIISEIQLPLDEGAIIGKIEYTYDDSTIGSVNLISPISIDEQIDFSTKLFNSIKKIPLIFKIIFFLFIAIIILRIYNKTRVKIRRKKRQKERELLRRKQTAEY